MQKKMKGDKDDERLQQNSLGDGKQMENSVQ